MIAKKDITAIILAGGKSSRMRSDKGLMELGDKPFVQYIIDAVKPAVSDLIIVSNNKEYDRFGFKRREDLITDVGPLGGIHSGLVHSNTQINLVVSCDVPMITKNVIDLLISNYDDNYEVIQTKSDHKTMPLVAIYHKTSSLKIEKWLSNNNRRVRDFVASVKLKTVTLNKNIASQLRNINTPEQLKEIKHVIAN